MDDIRRKYKKIINKITLNIGKLATVMLLIMGLVSLFWIYDAKQLAFYYYQELMVKVNKISGFKIKKIEIKGLEREAANKVKDIILSVAKNSSPFFNTSETKKLIEKLPWVKLANVELVFPGLVKVTVKIRKPVARYKKKDHLIPVDEQGKLLTGLADNMVNGLDRTPILIGSESLLHFNQLFKSLQPYPIITNNILGVQYISKRRWNLILSHGLIILLPEKNINKIFIRLNNLLKEHDLLSLNITRVDLRYPDKIVVRLSEQAYKQRLNKILQSLSDVSP